MRANPIDGTPSVICAAVPSRGDKGGKLTICCDDRSATAQFLNQDAQLAAGRGWGRGHRIYVGFPLQIIIEVWSSGSEVLKDSEHLCSDVLITTFCSTLPWLRV